jgi:hypothetical protein
MGDFNAIRNQSDRLGGSSTWAGTMDRLETCIREAKVDDLRYSFMHYTWSNQCLENLIMRKLDRVLVNKKWDLNFPLSEDRFLPSGMSDHSSGMGSDFWGLSNVSVVLQTKKAKAGIETFQYDLLLQHLR